MSPGVNLTVTSKSTIMGEGYIHSGRISHCVDARHCSYMETNCVFILDQE